MSNKIMKTLTLGGNTYEIYDEAARGSVLELEQVTSQLQEQNASSIGYDDSVTKLGATNVQDAIGQLSKIGNQTGTGLSTEAIDKLEEVGNYLAYAIADGGSKWTELIAVLRGSSGGETEVTLSSISATYSGGSVLVGTSVNALTGIVVTAKYSDGSTKTVTGYTLSGTIAEGSNTVTISYGGKSTTITVIGYAENEEEIILTSISATYTGGEVTVGTELTDLTGITVTGHYSDGSTVAITGYTLSGEIVEGSNTITVTYSGLTTTFTVTGVAESGGEVIETLPLICTSSYPESETFEYTEIETPIHYLLAKQETTTGGKLNFTFDLDDTSHIGAAIFLFENGEPSKIYCTDGSGKYVTGNLNDVLKELEVGNTSWVFGNIISPASFTIPENCNVMVSIRRNSATSTNNLFDSNATFAQWVKDNLKLTITN